MYFIQRNQLHQYFTNLSSKTKTIPSTATITSLAQSDQAATGGALAQTLRREDCELV